MHNYQDMLKSSTLKSTPQRLAILSTINSKGHATIEEIYSDIKESFPSISLATIYKNIASLKDEQIVSEVCNHHKPKFEITKEPHAHFICQKCGEIEDIDFSKAITKEIEKNYPNSHKELYIYGVCSKCSS
jgi:Fe2+ or Zn2+ uptake regulation protein